MTNNITRHEISEAIFNEIGLSRSECNDFVDDIIDDEGSIVLASLKCDKRN